MNYSQSMRKYVDVDIQAKAAVDNPHKIIQEVLIELIKNMKTLAYALDNEPVRSDMKSKAFSKSITAIYILQSSLDFEKGGEIASNLFNLYDYCKRGIMKGFTKQDSKLIYDAIPPIDEILDGWRQISN
mgnify:FL=1